MRGNSEPPQLAGEGSPFSEDPYEKSPFLVLLGVAATLGCAVRHPDDANVNERGKGEFGKMVAGSYLVEEEEWPTPSGETLSGQGVVRLTLSSARRGETAPSSRLSRFLMTTIAVGSSAGSSAKSGS
jgi:hypothetical protein